MDETLNRWVDDHNRLKKLIQETHKLRVRMESAYHKHIANILTESESNERDFAVDPSIRVVVEDHGRPSYNALFVQGDASPAAGYYAAAAASSSSSSSSSRSKKAKANAVAASSSSSSSSSSSGSKKARAGSSSSSSSSSSRAKKAKAKAATASSSSSSSSKVSAAATSRSSSSGVRRRSRKHARDSDGNDDEPPQKVSKGHRSGVIDISFGDAIQFTRVQVQKRMFITDITSHESRFVLLCAIYPTVRMSDMQKLFIDYGSPHRFSDYVKKFHAWINIASDNPRDKTFELRDELRQAYAEDLDRIKHAVLRDVNNWPQLQ